MPEPIRKQGTPSNTVLIAAVVVALIGMALVNSFTLSLDPKEIQRREQEQAEAAMRKMEQQTTEKATGGSPEANSLVALGEESVVGNKDSKTEIILAWEWTPDVQANPSKIYSAVESAKKGAPNAKIRVVNVDAKPEMQPGVYVNGNLIRPAQSDGSLPAEEKEYADIEDTAAPGS
jgi:type II secretory pathway pseudopilin PulG